MAGRGLVALCKGTVVSAALLGVWNREPPQLGSPGGGVWVLFLFLC